MRRAARSPAHLLAAGSCALALSGLAAAQDESLPDAERLRTGYGAWTLRCTPRENAAPCDIVTALNERESGVQVIAVSLAYSAPDAMTAVQIIAPLGVHLPTGLTITAGAASAAGVRFTRCELQGCFVEGRLAEDMIAAMQDADALGLTFGLSADDDATIDVSLDGFAEAYAALIAETTARTPPPPPPADE